MYLMNIFVPGMLYYGPVVRQVLSWADVRRPPAPCGSGCHSHRHARRPRGRRVLHDRVGAAYTMMYAKFDGVPADDGDDS